MNNFPYPENSSDWQTAYTRDDAYEDSGKHAPKSSAGFFAMIIALAYAVFSSAILIISYPLHLYLKLGILLGVIILIIFMFSKVQYTAQSFASTFLKDFYQPPDGIDLEKIIANRLSGKSKLPPPLDLFSTFDYIIASEGEIKKSNEWPAWSACHLGGPILLIVFDGCALYLERGNRFSRVVGPGDKVPFLEWHETVKYVVDLRPKVRDGEFDAWTKDGINIKLKVQIECRIGDPKNHDPASNLVYPYDPVAVKKAVERYSVRWPNRIDPEPSDFTWADAAWGQVTGIVPGYIGSRILDDLFMADRNGGQILSPNAVQEIFGKLNGATQGFGVYITDFQVMEIKLPKAVVATQNDQWKTERQSIDTIMDGQTKASHIRSREKASADAQRELILSIADGLKKNKDGQYEEPLLLSLSGILDNSLQDPLMRAYLAKETMDTLNQVRSFLNQNEPSELKKIFNKGGK